MNRLDTRAAVADLLAGAEINIGQASRADRVKLRRAAGRVGLTLAIVKVGLSYTANVKEVKPCT
ncbi:hypothetical protein CUW27_20790 [Salmonella enterica]|nr:hypothetical protein [Salmonella enterica]